MTKSMILHKSYIQWMEYSGASLYYWSDERDVQHSQASLQSRPSHQRWIGATIYTAIIIQRSLWAPSLRGRIMLVQSINTMSAWVTGNHRAGIILKPISDRMCSMWALGLFIGKWLPYWQYISVWTSMLLFSLLNTIRKSGSTEDCNTRNGTFE